MDCSGDAIACEQAFQESNENYQALARGQSTMSQTRATVEDHSNSIQSARFPCPPV